MSLNQYYCDILMQGPGLILLGGRFRVDGTNSPDLVVDGRPNLVAITVAYNDSTKEYTVTIPKIGGSLPQELITCIPALAFADATAAGVDVTNVPGYVQGSYSPTTGSFVILNSQNTLSGTANTVAVFPDNAEIHFLALFRNEKRLGQTV